MEAAVVSGAQQLEATAPVGPETEGTGAPALPSLPPTTSASTLGVLTNKRIEFHLARKQYGGLGRSGDFRIETLNPDSGRKRPASDTGLDRPADGSNYGENGLDPELSIGITFRRIVRIGAGLENLGNTCFLNSVLQCLTYTEPLAAYLQSGRHQNSCHIAGFCALCAIQKHVSRALQSSGRSLVPKDLVSNLRCISRNFRNARQEDAHEYMVNLLESMHKCCLPFGVPAESPAAYEKSLVHKIFGGHLRSQVECQQCYYCSDKFDPFLDLSLEIVKADSLPTALRNFTAAEILDGGGKHYQCQRCKEKVKAKKRLTVHKVPYVLTIHLKRFHAHDPGRKVDKKVHFDRTLDLKPFSSGSYEGDLNYSLYGVLVHLGHNTHSGHYVCFVRTSSGMWHLLNDKQVCQVSEKTVLDQKAYMLFYVQDRKTIPLQKPVDIVIQENVKATAGSDITNLFFKQISKEHTSDVSNDKKANSAFLSATVNQNEVNALSENHQRGKSVQENSMVAMPDSSMLKAEPTMKPSSAPMLKDPVAPSSVSVTNACPSSPSGSHKPHNATNLTGAKTSDCNMASSSCNTSQFSRDMLNKATQKMNQVVHGGVPVEVPVKDTSNRAAGDVKRSILSKDFGGKMMDADPLPSKPSCGIAQGGGFTSGSAGGEETVPKSVNSSTPATPLETLSGKAFDHKPTSSTPVTSNETLNIKASDCEPKSSTPVTANEKLNSKASACATTLKKSKKKLMRHRIPSLQLRATLFWPSLGIRKKWKHKKVKNIILDGNLLNDNCLSIESMLPLPQDMTVMNGLTNSLKKRSNFGPRESNILTKGGGRVLVGVTNEEVKVKDCPRPELAIDKKLQKVLISTSETNQQVVNKLESANRCKTNGMQTPLMRMLTRGLEETTVARWDGVELPPSPIEDANGADLSIGYVPDDWDEEYDRGKRKKLRRSKHQFGGPNPFQEIASKKAKHDRAKRNWSSSRNPPFRI